MKLGAVAVFAALFSGANAWHQGAIGWRPGGVPCVVASGNTTKWLSWVGVLCPPDWQIQLQVSGTGQRRIYPPKPTKTSNKIAADPPSSPIPSPSSAWYSHIIAWLTDGTTWEAATGGTAKWFIWLEELRLPSWKIQRQELATGQHSRLHVAAKANMTLAVEPPVSTMSSAPIAWPTVTTHYMPPPRGCPAAYETVTAPCPTMTIQPAEPAVEVATIQPFKGLWPFADLSWAVAALSLSLIYALAVFIGLAGKFFKGKAAPSKYVLVDPDKLEELFSMLLTGHSATD